MKSINRVLVAIICICFLLPESSMADVLVLKNGDRITGEIKRIWDDEITIEPSYSDEFEVDLPVVDHIESDRDFELDLTDGRSMTIRFAGADEEGNQIIETPVDTLSIPLASVLELDEVEDYYDWETNVDYSSSFNKGNTDSSNSRLQANGMFKHGDHRHRAEVSFLREDISNTTSQQQDRFTYAYNWLFNDPWFFSSGLTLERDPIIDLDNRTIVNAGIGYDVWNTPRRSLSVQLAAGYQDEKISGLSQDSTVGIWSLRFRQDFFGDNLEFFHNHTIRSNLTGRSNTSYRTSTGLNFEITDLMYATASVDYDYETAPAQTAKSEDIGVLFGLGLEFD
jgi:putative salt-induced outer membrane protein YdiY